MGNPFGKRPRGPALSREAADRQGRILQIAIAALGASAAIAYLNAHDETLGARPLDLAIANPDGFLAVEAALRLHMSA